MSLNQFPGARVLVTTLCVHYFHLPFMALPLCKDQSKGAVNRAQTLKTTPIVLNCNTIPTGFSEWADVPVVHTRTTADPWGLPSSEEQNSSAKVAALQPSSSEAPEDGDTSTKTRNQELERRRCRETNVLINYPEQKWMELIAGLILV